MMEIDRRALYNSLRMNWLFDPTMEVAPWQVEDYRSVPLDALFQRLSLHDINLDRTTFHLFAEDFDSPEDLVDSFFEDETEFDGTTRDQVYLLVFEIWRRLLPGRYCLSIFCDELDFQIYLYDSGNAASSEGIQDALANFKVILDENTDQGNKPVDVFISISSGCANNIENFLIDFITEQVDIGNFSYASELLEAFYDYVQEIKWFEFLQARILSEDDPETAAKMIRALLKDAAKENDLEFNLELLAFLVQAGEKIVFINFAKLCVPLLANEEDLQDLLSICADFYHRIDEDLQETALQNILTNREGIALDMPISKKDQGVAKLVEILAKK